MKNKLSILFPYFLVILGFGCLSISAALTIRNYRQHKAQARMDAQIIPMITKSFYEKMASQGVKKDSIIIYDIHYVIVKKK